MGETKRSYTIGTGEVIDYNTLQSRNTTFVTYYIPQTGVLGATYEEVEGEIFIDSTTQILWFRPKDGSPNYIIKAPKHLYWGWFHGVTVW